MTQTRTYDTFVLFEPHNKPLMLLQGTLIATLKSTVSSWLCKTVRNERKLEAISGARIFFEISPLCPFVFDDEQIVGDIVQSISGLGLGDLNEQAFLISKPLYFETTAAI